MKIIHKELSYAVRGVLFDVHNHLGPMLPEKFVQDAVVIGLEANGIRCEAEKMFEVTYCGDPSLMHLSNAELLNEALEVLHYVHF